MIRIRSLALCALLTGSPLVAQAGPSDERFTLGGFGTAALAHNSADGAEFIRDVLQPHGARNGWNSNVDSRLGLQASFRATPELEGVVQAVSLYGSGSSYKPDLSWAFLAYSPDPSFKARVGRLGWDVFLISDSRNVGYSYPWVRPPVDYFGQLLIEHLDGADVSLTHLAGNGLATLKVYAGGVKQKIPSAPGPDFDISGSSVLGANLDFRQGDWLARVGYTRFRFASESPAFAPLFAQLEMVGTPGAADLERDLAFKGKTIQIVSAGIAWDHGPWQSSLMYNARTSNAISLHRMDSGYFYVGHRIQKWTAFATLAAARSRTVGASTGLPTPNPLDDAVAGNLRATGADQQSASLGIRYDFMRDMDLKVQVDRFRVKDNATFLWRDAAPDWNGRATVLTVSLDFVF
jgi:hypothetical protein